MTDSEDILFGRAGGVATVTLNRPQQLNAFTLGMYRRFDPMLREWAADPAIHTIVIKGAEGRAFCAGGDIRAIYDAGRGIAGDRSLTSDFFREEYELIRRLHRYPKPYIALIDGIAMGGGLGVSVNGAYRIATERAMFAMPETGIGLFPDVGATRFLNLCPGQIGRYLGIIGARLGTADALYCGFATHFVPRQRLQGLEQALQQVVWRPDREFAQVEEVLTAFRLPPETPPLAAHAAAIDRNFAGDSVESILASLEVDMKLNGADGEWAAQTHADLLTKSPTSLKITLAQLRIGAGCNIEDALTLEYRMTQRAMAGHDFYEGVRAALVDKDRQPRWQPARLDEVTEAMVEAYFAPLGKGELLFD